MTTKPLAVSGRLKAAAAPAGRAPPVELTTVLVVADLTVVVMAIMVTHAIMQIIGERVAIGGGNGFVVVTMLTLPVWPAVFSRQRLYSTRFIGRRIDEVRRIFNAVGLGVL